MRLLITGATGFLGQYVVAEALRQNYQICAVVRPTSDEKQLVWAKHPSVELIRCDLKDLNPLVEVLQNVSAVIHLAAAKTGDWKTQLQGTVEITKNLLKAMVQADVRRLIAISSFSVFDYLNIPSCDLLNEDSPLEQNPTQRDIYAQMKLMQEQLFRDFQQNQGGKVTIFRPGVIYGRNNHWNARLGVQVGNKLWLLIGQNAKLPLIYVENCAEAIIAALKSSKAIGVTINLVDDDLPTQKTYIETLLKYTDLSPRRVFISWKGMSFLANTVWSLNQSLFQGKINLPGILIPARFQARFKPLNYENSKAKQILDWQPKYGLETALSRSCSTTELLNVPDSVTSDEE